MIRIDAVKSRRTRTILAAGCLSILLAGPVAAIPVVQTNLVTDNQSVLTGLGYTPAVSVDPHLINPWGVSYAPTGPFWVSNQGDNTSTLYNGAADVLPLVVQTPGSIPGPSGPTGQVFNGTTSFNLSDGAPGRFFFANLDGSISGWNPASGTTATRVVGSSTMTRPAIYTGLSLGSVAGQDYLYAANEATGRVDVFDTSFNAATLAGGFVDPGSDLAGYVPFNVKTIGDHVYVTYSTGGPDADEAALGSGFVSEFNQDGTFVRRLASGGELASPWGLAIAPSTFGDLAGSLLVANFNEEFGTINAFSLADGSFLGSLEDADGNPINVPYLWEIITGNGAAGGDAGSLYFAAGIGDEEHGLFGRFDAAAAAVPDPASWAMMTIGMGLIGAAVRRRRRHEEQVDLIG
jgi:uncharacterized protein (TIGR03118 family)